MFSDRDYRKLFENAPAGLAVCRRDGRLVLVNQAFADILGRSIEETMSLDYWNITPRKYAASEEFQIKQLEQTGRYGPYEKHYIHKDGSLRPVRLNGCLVSIDQNDYIWSAVEQLDLPLHSSTLIREAPVGLALCHEDGSLVAVNRAFADIIGYTVEEVLNLSYWEITPRRFAADEDVQLERLRSTGSYGPYFKKYIHKTRRLVDVVLIGKLLHINGEAFIWSVVQEQDFEDGGSVTNLDATPIRERGLEQGLLMSKDDDWGAIHPVREEEDRSEDE